MTFQDKYKALLTILQQTKEYYPIIFIYSVCVSILTLATPISVQSLVNTFSLGPYFQPLFVLSMILLGLLLVLGLLKSLQYLLVEYLERRVYAKITAQVTQTFYKKESCQEGDLSLANRYFDTVIIQKKLAELVTEGIALFLQTFLGLLLLCFYHPYFIVFSIIILIAIIAPLYFFGRSALYYAVKESTEKYNMADFIEDLAHTKEKEEDLLNKGDAQISNFLSARSNHFRFLFTQNIIYVLSYAFLNALLLALGGYLVISNQISVGQLVASEIVVNAILKDFLSAKKFLASFYDMYAASEKVKSFITNEEIKDADIDRFKSIKSVYAPKRYKVIFRNFAIGTAILVLALLLTPWLQTSTGKGKVTALNPNDRAQFITSNLDGIVEEWLVQDGQNVRKGDPIVRVVDNDPNYLVRLEARRDAAVKKFEAAKEASDTARLNFHRQEKLMNEGLSSRKEFEKANITYKKLLAEEASAAASLAKEEVALSRQQLQLITAPRDGQILRILQGSGSTIVKKGAPLVEFVPDTVSSAVEIFIDGNDLPLVYEGRKVRLQFEGWPSIQFSGWPSVAIGSFGGIVKFVDSSVSANGEFRVLVVPDPEDANPWPTDAHLRQGSRALGLILLDQVSIGYELWRKVNGFPKSMDSAPTYQGDKKNAK